MEDDERDVLGLLHERIDPGEEAVRWLVTCALDVPAFPVVVPDVDHDVVLHGDLVALDDLCDLLHSQSGPSAPKGLRA